MADFKYGGSGPRGYPRYNPSGGGSSGSGFQNPYYGQRTPPSGGQLPPTIDLPAFGQSTGPLTDLLPNLYSPANLPVPWDQAKPPAKPAHRGIAAPALRALGRMNAVISGLEFASQFYNTTQWDMSGWELMCDDLGPGRQAMGGGASCTIEFAPFGSGNPWPGGDYIAFGYLAVPNYGGTFTLDMYDINQVWHRLDPANPDPRSIPSVLPTLRPSTRPMGGDRVGPDIMHENRTTHEVQGGYSVPQGFPGQYPEGRTRPRAWDLASPENAGKTFIWEVSKTGTRPNERVKPAEKTGGRPRITLRPPVRTKWPELPRVPPPKTRERKGKWIGPVKIAEAVTESCDAVKAVYAALPEYAQRQGPNGLAPVQGSRRRAARSGTKEKRGGPGNKARWSRPPDEFGSRAKPPRRSCLNMAKTIYAHSDAIDLNEAIWNLLTNEFQDRVLGTASSKANAAYRGHTAGAGGATTGPAL